MGSISRFLIAVTALFVGVCAQSSTPFLSFPVAIDGKSAQLAAFSDQTRDQVIAGFCHRNGLDYEAVGPALLGALSERLAAKPSDAIIFTFKVMLDSKEIEVNMHEGWTVADTVRNFCAAYNIDVSAVGEQLVTLFIQQIEEYKASGIVEPEPATPMKSFTIPVDGVEYELHHYEGADEVEEARAFCLAHGFLTDELMAACLPPVVGLVRSTLAEPVPEPLFTLPILVDGVERDLVYYSGQDPSEVARAFLLDTGVTGPSVEGAVGQLATLIVDRATVLKKAAAGEAKVHAPAPTTPAPVPAPAATPGAGLAVSLPLFTVPIAIDGVVYPLTYYSGQDPLSVARMFCLNRWGMISDALLTSVPGLNKGEEPVELEVCTELLSDMIAAMGARVAKKVEDPKELLEREALPEELFSLTVQVAPGQYAELVFLAGMVPHSAAVEFSARHGLGADAVPILEGAIIDALKTAKA